MRKTGRKGQSLQQKAAEKGMGRMTDKEEKWENRSWRSATDRKDIRTS